MSTAILTEPDQELELEMEDGDVDDDVDTGDDGGDDDEHGWLINCMDGRQPIVQCLDGTPDEGMTPDEVFERFDEADKHGHRWFKLGLYRGRMDAIRDISWSDTAELPELSASERLQERVESMMDGVDETNAAVRDAAQGTVLLQQQMVALQEAQAVLFDALGAEGDLEDVAPAGQAQPSGKLKPLRMGGSKLPPGVRPS